MCNSFTEDTLWTGTPGDYTNQNAPEALAEVRKLVDGGNFSEATAAAVKLSGDPSDVCNIMEITKTIILQVSLYSTTSSYFSK